MRLQTTDYRPQTMKSVAEIGENALIRQLSRLVPGRADVVAGIGDDCAVVRVGGRYDLLLKSDPVIERVHFSPGTPGERIGHKAVGRVLSDVAAMGGEPLWILMDLVAPAKTAVRRIEALYRGAARLARRHGAAIVGGDTSRGPALELHVFAVGRVPRGKAVLRSGARVGDRVYVTGVLGGSLQGWHLRFPPRLAEGRWLREGGWVTAMMDVSDGLAADLPRLAAASGVGVEVEADAIPVSPAARCADHRPQTKDIRRKKGGESPAAGARSGLAHALGDGEDFELVFTVPACKSAAFEQAWRRKFRLRCSAIGWITGAKGRVRLREGDRISALDVAGYEHFRDRR